MPLDELVAHVGVLALAFTAAARKDFGPMTDTPPADGAPLDEDWRTAYPARLAELARAWQDPAAWQGMSRAGGIDFPGEVGGSIALAEVVLHGWDVASAAGVAYDADEATTNALRHGRPGAPLDVALRRESGEIVLTVRNARCADAEVAARVPGEGHGLVGMRERATAVGGRLDVRPGARRGTVVEAVLPLSIPATDR